ncbi:2547_t:CDS:2, partial [Scutellospora calospora]
MNINKFDTSSSVKTTQLDSINAIKDTFDTSFLARNNDILSQPELIVLSDTDDELPIESTKSLFLINYENNLQIIKSENSSNWEDDDILLDNLINDNILVENLEDKVETSLTGIASIYNVSSWKPEEAKKVFGLSNIQYAYGDLENIRSIQIYLFLGVRVQKTYRSCHSVKICEFSSATLNIEHTSVNFEDQLYKKIFDANEFSVNTFTLNTYAQAYNTPCSYIDSITNVHCNGNSVLREYKQNCENKPINECYTVVSNSSTTSYCSYLHKTDTQVMKGKLINKGQCPVKFYHILPNNLNECPFIVIISIGIHNHPPPPLTKTLYNIVENLQKIIENEYDLDLTARKFLTRPILKIYLQEKLLSSLHPSLNNQLRLNYLIEKNKRSKYPFGQDIIGVAYELLKQKDLSNLYIRSV